MMTTLPSTPVSWAVSLRTTSALAAAPGTRHPARDPRPASSRPQLRAPGGGQSDLSGLSGLRKGDEHSPWEGFSAHFTDKINQI